MMNINLKLKKTAIAYAILASLGSTCYVYAESPSTITSEEQARTIEVNNDASFRNALNIAQTGDTIRFISDISLTDYTQTHGGNADPLYLDKNITIDGNGHSLSVRAAPLALKADVVLKNLSLQLKPLNKQLSISTEAEELTSYIYANGYRLELDNVSTKSEGLHERTRPTIIMGTVDDQVADAGHSELVIKNSQAETQFKQIIANSLNQDKSTPSKISLDKEVKLIENTGLQIDFSAADHSMTGKVEVVLAGTKITTLGGNNATDNDITLKNVSMVNPKLVGIKNLTLEKSSIAVGGLNINGELALNQNSQLSIDSYTSDFSADNTPEADRKKVQAQSVTSNGGTIELRVEESKVNIAGNMTGDLTLKISPNANLSGDVVIVNGANNANITSGNAVYKVEKHGDNKWVVSKNPPEGINDNEDFDDDDEENWTVIPDPNSTTAEKPSEEDTAGQTETPPQPQTPPSETTEPQGEQNATNNTASNQGNEATPEPTPTEKPSEENTAGQAETPPQPQTPPSETAEPQGEQNATNDAASSVENEATPEPAPTEKPSEENTAGQAETPPQPQTPPSETTEPQGEQDATNDTASNVETEATPEPAPTEKPNEENTAGQTETATQPQTPASETTEPQGEQNATNDTASSVENEDTSEPAPKENPSEENTAGQTETPVQPQTPASETIEPQGEQDATNDTASSVENEATPEPAPTENPSEGTTSTQNGSDEDVTAAKNNNENQTASEPNDQTKLDTADNNDGAMAEKNSASETEDAVNHTATATDKQTIEQPQPNLNIQKADLILDMLHNAMLTNAYQNTNALMERNERRAEKETQFWIKNSITKGQNEAFTPHAKDHSKHLMIGADKCSETYCVGFAFSTHRHNMRSDNLALQHKMHSAFGYGNYALNQNINTDFYLGAGMGSVKDRLSHISYQAKSLQTGIGLGYQIEAESYRITPFIRADYVATHYAPYQTETLAIASHTAKSLIAQTGLLLRKQFTPHFSAFARASLSVEMLKNSGVLINVSNYQGSRRMLQSSRLGKIIGAGISYHITPNAQISAGYYGEQRKHNHNRSADLSLQFTF